MTEVRITGDPELIPTYANEGDAGCDLRAAHGVKLYPGNRALVKTGIFLALPKDIVALVHPRSGLALRDGLTVLNTPGTIDSGYRGEVGVILYNAGDIPYEVRRGDRIAQLVFQKFEVPTFIYVDSLDETERGTGGFGSSGVQ